MSLFGDKSQLDDLCRFTGRGFKLPLAYFRPALAVPVVVRAIAKPSSPISMMATDAMALLLDIPPSTPDY